MPDDVGAVGEHGDPGGFCGGLTAASGPWSGLGRDRALVTELKAKDKEWIPITKLGLLVKDVKVKCLEEIYLSLLAH